MSIANNQNTCLQLFRERLSEKVHPIIPNGNVRSFEFTVLQRNLKEWDERPWTYVCESLRKATKVGSTATVSEKSILIISHITFRAFSRAQFFRQPFSKQLYTWRGNPKSNHVSKSIIYAQNCNRIQQNQLTLVSFINLKAANKM